MPYDTRKIEELKLDFYNPYSFVPLADSPCFLPDEEKERLMFSHDIPFSDGMSGHVDVRFRAETPVCVKRDNEHSENVNVSGRYFIPGSSIKGMLRNVLEIISMSNIKKVMSDDRYSTRDLGTNSDYSLKPDSGVYTPQKPGFLFIMNDQYYIMPCNAEEEQIGYRDMQPGLSGCLTNPKSKIADKYRAAGNDGVVVSGGRRYMWLFSGFMNKKNHEYRLPIPDFSGEPIPLTGSHLKDFLFIHEEENDNKSWAFWKKRIEKPNYKSLYDIIADNCHGIAPCFYRTTDDGREVRDLGFAYLYREPCKYSVTNLLPEDYKQEKLDIATSIFGYTGGLSLKGRVQVQNAFVNDAKVDSERWFILGSPKPSFYPFYIEQAEPGKALHSYSDGEGYISGWKRYLVHEKEKESDNNVKGKGSSSVFSPLKKGTEFTVRINYHNLRPYELGALMSAITFNSKKGCYHSLGYAKPFGYGKLSVIKVDASFDVDAMISKFSDKVLALSGISRDDWEYYLSPMYDIVSGNYKKKIIRYPHLDKDEFGNRSKEFKMIKDQKKTISDFSPVDE